MVFNAPHGGTTDTEKSYIVDNGVDVLDIKRRSQEEWDTQTFYIYVRYDDLSKVTDAEFWPKHIGYIGITKREELSTTMEELHNNNNLVVCSLNCEGVRRSRDYIYYFFGHQ